MKTIALGVSGAGPSVRSDMKLLAWRGLIYVEITDLETGANRRIARIAISPDSMVSIGRALVALGEGANMDDLDHAGFSRVTSSVK